MAKSWKDTLRKGCPPLLWNGAQVSIGLPRLYHCLPSVQTASFRGGSEASSIRYRGIGALLLYASAIWCWKEAEDFRGLSLRSKPGWNHEVAWKAFGIFLLTLSSSVFLLTSSFVPPSKKLMIAQSRRQPCFLSRSRVNQFIWSYVLIKCCRATAESSNHIWKSIW